MVLIFVNQVLMITRLPERASHWDQLGIDLRTRGTYPFLRLAAADIERVQSSKAGLTETGMKTPGNAVVLVPVTPSPVGCGYA